MPPTFSIVLPTLRPKLLALTLHSIHRNSVGHDYEVVVVSPFDASGDRVRWSPERIVGGPIAAHAQGVGDSRGDILITMTDDTIALPGWLDTIEQRIATGERTWVPFCLGLNRINSPAVGTVFGRYYAYFPIMSRRSVDALGGMYGGMYDTAYRGNWADPDLGLRIWASGGRVEFCAEARTMASTLQRYFPEAEHKNTRPQVRFEMFFERWGHLAGDTFSRRLVDVNRNFPLSVLRNNTVYVEQVKLPRSFIERAAREWHWQYLRVISRLWREWNRVRLRNYDSSYLDDWTPEQMYLHEIRRASRSLIGRFGRGGYVSRASVGSLVQEVPFTQ
jgi:glycosyltransferase involved in cell wall biosynthesis